MENNKKGFCYEIYIINTEKYNDYVIGPCITKINEKDVALNQLAEDFISCYEEEIVQECMNCVKDTPGEWKFIVEINGEYTSGFNGEVTEYDIKLDHLKILSKEEYPFPD